MKIIIQHTMHEHLTVFEDSTNFMQRLSGLDHPPVIVLMDIQMRPHNGFELLEMLRADPAYSDIPVVALTASVMNEEVNRLREAGFNGAIAKPFSIKSLPTLLKRIQNGESVWNITY